MLVCLLKLMLKAAFITASESVAAHNIVEINFSVLQKYITCSSA